MLTPVLSPAETLSHVWLSEVLCYNTQFTYKSSRAENFYSMITATYESMLQTSLREDTSLTKDKLEKILQEIKPFQILFYFKYLQFK